MKVDRAALERLAEKYRTLGELRRERARGAPIPHRDVFRELAEEFPGALFELDRLELAAIDERRDAIVRALAGEGAIEEWMGMAIAFHATYRAALRAKSKLRNVERPVARSDAEKIAKEIGAPADADLVLEVASPPRGRLKPIVLARVARDFDRDARDVEAAVFPTAPRVR